MSEEGVEMNHYIGCTKQMFCYETGPLDHFQGLTSLTEEVDRINRVFNNEPYRHASLMELFSFVMFCAREIAKTNSCWEGDIRHHIGSDDHTYYENNAYIFSIPNPDYATCSYGMIWKQDNNGTTFICSPLELPHLAEGALN